jgi:hypothetical protein
MTRIRHAWIDGQAYELTRDRSPRLCEHYPQRVGGPDGN